MMAAIVNGNEIILTGAVGLDWWGDCFTHTDVITALSKVDKSNGISVRLNSGGGDATEGAAIHAALRGAKASVEVTVEGVAASAASLIAMAGDKIEMAPGAVMMIHDPIGYTVGDAAGHQRTIDALNAIGDAYAEIYAARCGKTKAEARQIMLDETWMNGEQAIAMGFADRCIPEGGDDEGDEEGPPDHIAPTAFAYRIYAKAPQPFMAMADAHGWSVRASAISLSRPPTANSTDKKEKLMSEQTSVAAAQAPDFDASAAAEIAAAAHAAGVPSMASALIKARIPIDQAKARIADAGEIKAICANAKKLSPAIDAEALEAEFIAAGTSPAGARAALWDKVIDAQGPEINSSRSTGRDSGQSRQVDAAAVYDRMNASLAPKRAAQKE